MSSTRFLPLAGITTVLAVVSYFGLSLLIPHQTHEAPQEALKAEDVFAGEASESNAPPPPTAPEAATEAAAASSEPLPTDTEALMPSDSAEATGEAPPMETVAEAPVEAAPEPAAAEPAPEAPVESAPVIAEAPASSAPAATVGSGTGLSRDELARIVAEAAARSAAETAKAIAEQATRKAAGQ